MTKFYKHRAGSLQFLLIILVWLLLFIIPLLFGDFTNGIKWDHIFKVWREYSFLFVIFLANHFVLMPYLFFREKRSLYFASIISLILLFSAFLYFGQFNAPEPQLSEFAPPHMGPGGPRDDPFNDPFIGPKMGPEMQGPREFIPPYANLFIMSILLIGFDSGLLFFSKWMKSEQNKLEAEKESIKSKMAFLQNQVSPHFFMNTLNNIHALVDIDKEEAKESIIKLSRMMDYMLYESQTSSIALKQEIDFIKSYVDLMKLRFTNDVDILLEISADLPPVKVPPLLTISFIENAFKYGVSYESPSFIHIYLDVSDNQLSFRVINSVHPGKEKRKNSGIGIQNTRSRLDLIYDNNYDLIINNENNRIFDVKLNIPL